MSTIVGGVTVKASPSVGVYFVSAGVKNQL